MGRTWHPYAPDQAFGRRAARDEELVDALLARMEARREPAPRAGNKANLIGSTMSFGSTATLGMESSRTGLLFGSVMSMLALTCG